MTEEFLADHLLIDMDGTLVDSQLAIAEAWSAWIPHYGITHEQLLPALGGTSADTVKKLVAPSKFEEALDLITQLELFTSSKVVATPGARNLINSIPTGRWSLVTSSRMIVLLARMSNAELPLPKIIISSDDYVCGKPSPDPYLIAFERVSIEPRNAVAVEDSEVGIASAKSAKLRVIASSACSPREDLSHATCVVSDLSKITISSFNTSLLIRTESSKWS